MKDNWEEFRKQNQKDRLWFIEFNVNFMKAQSDRKWSAGQNVLINSVLKTCYQDFDLWKELHSADKVTRK